MKASSILRAAILLMTLVLILSACSMLGTDIMDRINMFASSLNSDRSTINSNFDQGMTQLLPTMTTAWWAANFPPPDANHLYSVALSDYADPSNVVATISGPPLFNGGTGLPVNAVFVMSREGADWFIEQLFLNGSSTPIIY
jgi:hypothetical protein